MNTRRQFIKLLGGLAISVPLSAQFGCARQKSLPAFASAFSSKDGEHFFAGFDIDGNIVSSVELPARGHGTLALPNRPSEALVFARRPGNYIYRVDVVNGRVINAYATNSGRHVFGHGSISLDGKYLYVTENDFSKGRGIVSKRNIETFELIEEFESGGIGPHELKVIDDNRIVVANGGILTHPASPRKKLNLDSMLPNLSYIDVNTGKLIDQVVLPDHKLSLRHLDVSKKNGQVIVGTQYQGDKYLVQPLIFSHQQGQPLQPFKADIATWRSMNQYTASVCINETNNQVAISCPRGDKVTFWDLETLALVDDFSFRDCAGICIRNGQFLVSNGNSQLLHYTDNNSQLVYNREEIQWDNHMAALAT